ncbi:MAG: TetR/AcrR family transcriptional regulator [Mycobacterium sp.]
MIRQKVRRRSQEERSAETRTRLLDATIECLLRYGYAGTTTPRVAELAGVTRGAQVHHFGTKNDLMLAALQHLTAKRISTEVARFTLDFGSADDPIDAILQLVWDIHSAPIFVPIVELWVAGRTDAALGREVAKFESVANSTLMAVVAEFAPEGIHHAMADFVYTAMDALRGILISSFVDSDSTRARRRWERAATNLRRIVAPEIAEWAVVQAGAQRTS